MDTDWPAWCTLLLWKMETEITGILSINVRPSSPSAKNIRRLYLEAVNVTTSQVTTLPSQAVYAKYKGNLLTKAWTFTYDWSPLKTHIRPCNPQGDDTGHKTGRSSIQWNASRQSQLLWSDSLLNKIWSWAPSMGGGWGNRRQDGQTDWSLAEWSGLGLSLTAELFSNLLKKKQNERK